MSGGILLQHLLERYTTCLGFLNCGVLVAFQSIDTPGHCFSWDICITLPSTTNTTISSWNSFFDLRSHLFFPPSDFQKKLSPTTLPCDTACSKKPSIPNIPQQITVTKSQPTSHNQPKELPKPGYPSLLSPLLCVGSCKARLIHRRHILPHRRGGRVSNETVGGGYQLGDIRRISFKGMGYRYLEKPEVVPIFLRQLDCWF